MGLKYRMARPITSLYGAVSPVTGENLMFYQTFDREDGVNFHGEYASLEAAVDGLGFPTISVIPMGPRKTRVVLDAEGEAVEVWLVSYSASQRDRLFRAVA